MTKSKTKVKTKKYWGRGRELKRYCGCGRELVEDYEIEFFEKEGMCLACDSFRSDIESEMYDYE